jgi:hypothetical protein
VELPGQSSSLQYLLRVKAIPGVVLKPPLSCDQVLAAEIFETGYNCR